MDKEYEELYDKGFDEGLVEVEQEETTEEEVSQEEENVEEIDNKEEENSEELEQPEGEEVDIDTSNEEEETSEEEDVETDATDSKEAESKSGRTIKWNGQEITIEENEIDAFIQKGFDYTKKTQDLAKYRPFIELIDESGLSQEDLVLLNEAKKGNTDALGKIVSAANVDLFDINTDSDYKPEVKARNYDLEDVVDTIKNDAANSGVMDTYISSVPETTRNLFVENPQILKGLYEDQRNGVAGRVMPEVIKALALNPNADFLQTYQNIGARIMNSNKEQEEVTKKPKIEPNRDKKKKAALSKKTKSSIDQHRDIWEDDALYEEMKKKVNPMYRK